MHPSTYEVEDGLDLDFFAALKNMQSMHATESKNETENVNEPVCLITNEPLNAFHVALACNHRFNYEALYQEVLRQKGRIGLHTYHEKIGIHQIKCPYCRTLTNQLLPYIGPHPIIKRLNGVNSPASMCMPGIACSRCNANAFYEHDCNPYCLRHYNSASKTNLKSKKAVSGFGSGSVSVSVPNSTAMDAMDAMDAIAMSVKCAAEIKTGKNKGKQCSLNATQSGSAPHLCKKHSKCNVILH